MHFLMEKPTLSNIPKDTPINHLRVRHGGYDISGVLTDHGTVFPLEILNMLEKQGRIGELSQLVYSFVGACAQGALKRQFKELWIHQFKAQNPDGRVLVPV
ncbi:MAG: D-proline reductase (Dithiol) [Clostridiales bacterium 38_11]|nr:MAG: D-proline reductase (Dithiol) [Clostridiales bacterium 38_11]HBH12227.1 hypothetical protein [Clostridiales bacterium]